MIYRVLILLLILVTKLSPVQLQATGEGNIAPAKKGKRAQFLLSLNILLIGIRWKSARNTFTYAYLTA